MKKEFIKEFIKENKAAMVKRALIGLGIVVGLALVNTVLKDKDEAYDEDGNVISDDFGNDSDSAETAE